MTSLVKWTAWNYCETRQKKLLLQPKSYPSDR